MGTAAALTFRSGQPTVIELSGKRNISAANAPDGSIRTQYELSVDLKDDDKKTLIAGVAVIIEGIVENSDEVAFSVKAALECRYAFREEKCDEDFEDVKIVRVFCEPLFHRASMLAQEMAWRMGFTAVRLQVTFPNSSEIQPVSDTSIKEKGEIPKKRTRRPSKAK